MKTTGFKISLTVAAAVGTFLGWVILFSLALSPTAQGRAASAPGSLAKSAAEYVVGSKAAEKIAHPQGCDHPVFVTGGEMCAANDLSAPIVLVGSTPGDPGIKSLLGISADKPVDFIRWDLTLNGAAAGGSKTYVLDIVYGEGEPNTRGFKGGGEKFSFSGAYTARKSRKGDIYELKNETTAISLVKLNDNLFHLLTPDQRLMVGNGGWSYTLSRKEPSTNNSPILPAWTVSPPVDTAGQVVFDGRTPCLDFARHYDLQVGNDCFKLKWKLTLFKDPKTNQPTAYALQSTLDRRNTREGKWTIIKGVENNPGAIIYRLDPDEPVKSLSFLVGDENVLFFLDRENRLFTGNSDFSFTLNRRKL